MTLSPGDAFTVRITANFTRALFVVGAQSSGIAIVSLIVECNDPMKNAARPLRVSSLYVAIGSTVWRAS